MFPFNQTRLIKNAYSPRDASVIDLEFPNEEVFTTWFRKQNKVIEWNSHKNTNASKADEKLSESRAEQLSKRGRPVTVEWTKIFSCSFSSSPRIKPEPEEKEKRSSFKSTRKVGCKASIKAQKKFSGDEIFVKFNNIHTGHDLSTLDTWSQSSLSPATRACLQNVVGTGMDWKKFIRMTRDDCEKLELLGSENLESGTGVEVPEILRINYQDFYNYRRKQLTNTRQLHPNYWQSLLEYTRLVTEAGGIAILDDVLGDKVDKYNVSYFAFCSSWQIEVILKYESILFLDSTHNV